jgi:hypothetical protein
MPLMSQAYDVSQVAHRVRPGGSMPMVKISYCSVFARELLAACVPNRLFWQQRIVVAFLFLN